MRIRDTLHLDDIIVSPSLVDECLAVGFEKVPQREAALFDAQGQTTPGGLAAGQGPEMVRGSRAPEGAGSPVGGASAPDAVRQPFACEEAWWQLVSCPAKVPLTGARMPRAATTS